MENKISSRIKELRTSLNMTQAAFAKSIGTSQNALSGYENKDRVPSYDILMSIATKYNISLDWLCGLTEDSQNNSIISTYSDIINILISLSNNPNLSANIYNCVPNDCIEPPEFSPYVGIIQFRDKAITKFIEEWSDMRNLLDKGTIKKDLYDLWLKDQLEKYNVPITTDNVVSYSSSYSFPDGLPFT